MARTSRPAGSAPGARFLVERYWPGLTLERLKATEAKVRRASAAVSREGHPVRYLGSTFVPEEESVLAVFAAEAAEWVVEVNRRAGLPVDRVVAVVELRRAERAAPPSIEPAPASDRRAH